MKKKNVRELALEVLLQIEKNQAYSNLLLNNTIKSSGLQPKDVGLLTEIVYGTIQRKNTLDFYLQPYLKKPNKVELWVKVLLRLSAYQIVYLDRVPDHAVLNEAVEIAKKRGHKGISGMVNGVLRNLIRNDLNAIDEISDPVKRLALQFSHPEWLIQRWLNHFGEEETTLMCKANIKPPLVTVRVNTSKVSVEEMLERLQQEGLQVEKGDLSEDAIKVIKGNIPETSSFKEGLISIQDESSMLVARALNLTEGNRVLDSCAAPGGKSTHIGEILNNTGEVISLDIHEHKVKLIQSAAKRLDLTNIDAKKLDSRLVNEHFQTESFDKILVDAPCSGFGVIRRKPDIKWTKNESDIINLAKIQGDILKAVAPLLSKGGTLVYSTCTIDKEENGDVVQNFLKEHHDFSLDETLKERLPKYLDIKDGTMQLLPHQYNTDGFYIACLQKA
jgi:16S rRNA (cytosine967-C5)-methyltransferase